MNMANLAKTLNIVFSSCSLNFIGLILYSLKELLEAVVSLLLGMTVAKHGERTNGHFVGGLVATGVFGTRERFIPAQVEYAVKVRPSLNSL